MWTREMFGTDVYHLISAFIIYSILGWTVESIYMSFCNRKLTNRGFGKGPFCPIYGFGGVLGYLILSPLSGHYIKLYFAGAVLATAFDPEKVCFPAAVHIFHGCIVKRYDIIRKRIFVTHIQNDEIIRRISS